MGLRVNIVDKIFNNVKWSDVKLGCTIWEGLIDYSRFHWNRVRLEIDKAPF
jgi:hypothetical protein